MLHSIKYTMIEFGLLKECLTTVKQVFFHYQVGSLMDNRASKPYTLAGPPALQLVLDPLAVLLLDNQLYITNDRFFHFYIQINLISS